MACVPVLSVGVWASVVLGCVPVLGVRLHCMKTSFSPAAGQELGLQGLPQAHPAVLCAGRGTPRRSHVFRCNE